MSRSLDDPADRLLLLGLIGLAMQQKRCYDEKKYELKGYLCPGEQGELDGRCYRCDHLITERSNSDE